MKVTDKWFADNADLIIRQMEKISELQSEIARLTQRVRELEDANGWIPVMEREPTKTDHYQMARYFPDKKEFIRFSMYYSKTSGWNCHLYDTDFWRENLPLPDIEKEVKE